MRTLEHVPLQHVRLFVAGAAAAARTGTTPAGEQPAPPLRAALATAGSWVTLDKALELQQAASRRAVLVNLDRSLRHAVQYDAGDGGNVISSVCRVGTSRPGGPTFNIASAFVSRTHATMGFEDVGGVRVLVLRDQGSSNGTFVNSGGSGAFVRIKQARLCPPRPRSPLS